MPNLSELFSGDAPGPIASPEIEKVKRLRVAAPNQGLPPRSGLQDLMDYVAGAKAMMPTRQFTEPLTPDLGTALAVTMAPSGSRMQGSPAPSGPDPRQLMNAFIQKVQNLAKTGANPDLGPLPGQGSALGPMRAPTEPANPFPFRYSSGGTNPFQEGSQMVSNPRYQQSFMNRANDRIDRINAVNSQYGMPPIPYESPMAQMTPRSGAPGVMGNDTSLASLLRGGNINPELGPGHGMYNLKDAKLGQRLMDLMDIPTPSRETRINPGPKFLRNKPLRGTRND